MVSHELKEAFRLIDENGGDFEGEKDQQLIESAEKSLSLKFPPSYKEFLKVLGCGDIGGVEFYGLIDDNFENSSIPNVIWLTLEERKEGLNENLILVASVGVGSFYAFDTRYVDSNNESPVVVCNTAGNLSRVADNFGSFMLAEIESVL